MDDMLKSRQALNWIIDFLEANQIPYLICGGLAAMAYGAKRPLNDIDLYVPEQHYQTVINFGREHTSFGPARWVDKHWDVEYVQFDYKGQKIEVGSDHDLKIYDAINNRWHKKHLDFHEYSQITVLGRQVHIMDKQTLIIYKSKLSREVDLVDIMQIKD